jgi:GDP-mannose 6-dehydrogenase
MVEANAVTSDKQRVAVFGLGYVGCITAACLARDGHEVVGVDLKPEKVEAIGRGEAPLVEPGLSTLLSEGVRSGRLRATSDPAEAVWATDVAIVCVGTPTGPDEAPDLRALAESATQIGAALRTSDRPYTVMIRSTVPPGTAEELVAYTLATSAGRMVGTGETDILVLTVPEFLREATALKDYDDPPFFIVGAPNPPPDRARRMIGSLFTSCANRLRWVSYRTAELLKNVCNAYHAVKVVFANEAGALCQAAGIDGVELMSLFCEDTKLNISAAYLRPGLPFGGSCLPKDLRSLVELGRKYGVSVPLLGGTLRSNELHIDRAIGAIEALGRRRIGLEGLAFKPGTDDVRESPMVTIAERLIGRGYQLKIYDPLVYRSQSRNPHPGLAHLARLLVPKPEKLLRHAEVLIRSRSSTDLLQHAHGIGVQPVVIDLGRPPYRVLAETMPRPSLPPAPVVVDGAAAAAAGAAA